MAVVLGVRIFSKGSCLLALLFLVYLTNIGNAEIQLSLANNTKTVNEGGDLKVTCNTTSFFVEWVQRDGAFTSTGKGLNIPNIKRTYAGWYDCRKVIGGLIESVYVEVLYPAKFLNISVPSDPLNAGQTFKLQYKVEGKPDPETKFSSASGPYNKHTKGEGTFVIAINSVKCTDGGAYTLMTSNSVANDTHEEEILINCPPNLVIDKDVLDPRLGQNLTVKVLTTSYPYANFTWTYNGKTLTSNDTDFESDLSLSNFGLDQFGKYEVVVANDLGEKRHTFELAINGPPDPVQNLTVVGVTQTSVNLSWVSGYDYGDHQNFIIKAWNGTEYEDIASFEDKSGSHGMKNVSDVVKNLDSGVVYNIRVVANNSRGEAELSPNNVVFTTGPYKPTPVLEGDGLFVECNGTQKGAIVYWQSADGSYRTKNDHFDVFNISRNYTGLYSCMERANTTITVLETIFVDVQYPVKILSLNVTKNVLAVNDTYNINITIEGNPTPDTSLTKDGTILFQANNSNNFEVTVENVTCTLTGSVELKSENKLFDGTEHVDSVEEEVFVYCPPSPTRNLQNTTKPRLGEQVTLEMDNTGYPYPLYTWMFDGKVLRNVTGTHNEDDLKIKNVAIKSFGQYTVIMTNKFGSFNYNFTLKEDGPPDPVTDIGLSDVGSTTANIHFLTGFDYGANQNFIVQSFEDGSYENVAMFADNSTNHGPYQLSHVISSLEIGTTYNLSVLSSNSRGMGKRSSTILLSTKVPRSTTEVLEGDNVTLTCPDSNMTDVHWVDTTGQTVSLNATLIITNITRQATGTYKCEGKMENITKTFEDAYIDVQYSAKILNISVDQNKLNPNDTFMMELEVEGNPTPNVTFYNLKDSTIFYTYNKTGEMNITIESVTCDDLGSYQLTVSNKRGKDTRKEEIFVYCPPVVNKRAHIKQELYPRIAEMADIKIDNFGYPYPKYIWTFDQKNLTNHKDTDFGSILSMNISADDFGDYMVDMENTYGSLDVAFHVIAAGPPDPVRNLKVDNFTYNSVTLSWMSGFNYGSPQTFIVKRIMNGKETVFKNISDPSPRGLKTGDYVLAGLDSATSYNFTVYSMNKNGTSTAPLGSAAVQFQTSDEPSKKSHTGAIVGGLIGAIAGVALIVGVAMFLKKRRDRNSLRYERM